jgi:uncharacterized repeat protein (TIGR03803 family)
VIPEEEKRRGSTSFSNLIGRLKRQRTSRTRALLLFVLLELAALSPTAQTQTLTVLYSFAGYPTDGAGPSAGLLMDDVGNLYGTTEFGGNVNLDYCGGQGDPGCGTVFVLNPNGAETVLHNFDGPGGANPVASLISDAKGNLYGTTWFGGSGQCIDNVVVGCGVVFKLTGKKEVLLHDFAGLQDGAHSLGPVLMDAAGNLYGTAEFGGDLEGCNCGLVFKLTGKKETVLYNFKGNLKGNHDGAFPHAGLVMDRHGTLYGTTDGGGSTNSNCQDGGCGVVFKLVGSKESVLHRFTGTPDGEFPDAALFMDAKGTLYSTTADGGNSYNMGTVFAVSSSGKERVIHRFGPPLRHAGFGPQASVLRDAHGNLYGTTVFGGRHDGGIVFEIRADGTHRVLHNFCSAQNCADGAHPFGDLIMDKKGVLYGTAFGGGKNGNGVIFMITP